MHAKELLLCDARFCAQIFRLAFCPEQDSTILTWWIPQKCQIQFFYVSDRTQSYEHDAGTFLHCSCNPTHKCVFRRSSFLLTTPIYLLQSSLSRRPFNVEIWNSHFPCPPLQSWFWFQSAMEYPGLVLTWQHWRARAGQCCSLGKYSEFNHSPTLKGIAPASVCAYRNCFKLILSRVVVLHF